ncbi:hypothetical protein Trco_007033 [Trichoderma cornu-damae]|uniref:Uncharacterized protein n=1 Tax=Trichoderma cornu-damae TaxID=654480 RepID=A0A9P8QHQ9_9HYPO|nr:hypothetical protein Trco_007033 [Trichoderma cornu-damae]
MAFALLLPMLASGVAAQHMALPLINYDEVVNALNPNDPGYQVCTAAGDFISSCVAQAGGSEGLSTANAVSVAACACCLGTTDVAPIYSTCADYLGSEAPQLSSQISAIFHLTILTISVFSASKLVVHPFSGLLAEQGSRRNRARDGCWINRRTYQSVRYWRIRERFRKLIQCCRDTCARLYPNDGHITWTDEIDSYASTCRDWAVTGRSAETAYSVAKTFATFCEHFSDACSVSTAAPTGDTNTNDVPFPPPGTAGSSGETTAAGGRVTVTVTQGPATTTSHNAAPTAGLGFAAGALAVAGFAIML